MYDSIDNEEIAGLPEVPVEERFKTRLPRGYLSISQVGMYMRCGEAYYHRYVLERPSPSTHYQVQGRGVHKAAEKLHLLLIDQQEISEEEMVQVYSDLHDTEIKEVSAVLLEEEDDPGSIKDVGIAMTRKYWNVALGKEVDPETKLLYPRIKPIAAERIIHSEIQTESGEVLPFMGVIDVEEEHAIRDLKTKKKAASQAEADNSMQLSLYAYMTKKPLVGYSQIIKPTKRLPVRYLRTDSVRTTREIGHALEVVREVADDIARGRFRKTSPENWWCHEKWCPYWNECRGKPRP